MIIIECLHLSENTLHFYWESICAEFDGKLVIIVKNKHQYIHSAFVEHRRYKSVVCNKIRDETRQHKSNLLCVQCVLFYRYFCFHILSTHTHTRTSKLTQAHTHTTPRRNTEKDFAKCSDLFYFTLSFHLISLLRLFSPHFYFRLFKPSAVKLGCDWACSVSNETRVKFTWLHHFPITW